MILEVEKCFKGARRRGKGGWHRFFSVILQDNEYSWPCPCCSCFIYSSVECRYQGTCLTSFLKLRIQYLMLVLPPLRAGAPQYNRLNTLGSQIFVKLNCLMVGDTDKIIWVVVTLIALCLISFLRKPP